MLRLSALSLLFIVVLPFTAQAQEVSVGSLPANASQEVQESMASLIETEEQARANGNEEVAERAQRTQEWLQEQADFYDRNFTEVLDRESFTDIDATRYEDALNEYDQLIAKQAQNRLEGERDEQVTQEIETTQNTLDGILTDNQELFSDFQEGEYGPQDGGEDETGIDMSDAEPFIVETIMQTIGSSGREYVIEKVFPALAPTLLPLLGAFATLWLIFYGYRLWAGKQFDFFEVGFAAAIMFFVSVLLTPAGMDWFNAWIISPVEQSVFGLTTFFLALNDQNLPDSIFEKKPAFLGVLVYLENMLYESMTLMGFVFDAVVSDAWWGNKITAAIFGGAAYAATVSAVGFLLLYSIFVYVYAILAYYVMLSLGPVFIFFFAFPRTRPMFITWFRGIVNYLIMPLVATIILAITIHIIDATWASLEQYANSVKTISPEGSKADKTIEDDGVPWDQLIALVIVTVVSYILMLRVGDITAYLSNGVTTNLGALFQQSAQTMQTNMAIGAAGGFMAAKGATAAVSGQGVDARGQDG